MAQQLERPMRIKLISGGQTGVDRAALDAALAAGVESGGWCPEGRKAEDGIIPDRYPLTELHGAGYRQRTRQNVLDSDGTVIVYFTAPLGGTQETLDLCLEQHRPCLLVDGAQLSIETGVGRLRAFLRDNRITRLNVAGPRASSEPRAYAYAFALISKLLVSRSGE